jgi:two-component system, cell cycle response regulator DivK
MMPEMDGFPLAAVLFQEASWRNISVIVVTSPTVRGSIWHRNDPGEGHLPADRADHAHSPACSSVTTFRITGRSGLVTRILYVEDNEDNVYMLKMRLELTDEFEVLVAEDGEEGCAMAASEVPDLILMDLEMPVIDGWEATRRLKSKPETRSIPVIGLSAHALAGEREKALAAGCDDFDTKPVEFDRLVAKIRKLLG